MPNTVITWSREKVRLRRLFSLAGDLSTVHGSTLHATPVPVAGDGGGRRSWGHGSLLPGQTRRAPESPPHPGGRGSHAAPLPTGSRLRREERAEGCAPRSELRGRCRVDMPAARPVCRAGDSVSHVAASRTGASSDRLWLSGGSDGRPQAHDSRCPRSCSRLRAAHRAGGETQLRAGREEAAVRALLRGEKRFAARRRVAGTTPAPRTSDVE